MNDLKIVNNISSFDETKHSKTTKGVLEFIKESQTESEVKYWLNYGKKYKNVTPGTINKWIRSANKKIENIKKLK